MDNNFQYLKNLKMNYTNIKISLFSLIISMLISTSLLASSHREAPLISGDPLADNVDLYAFRSPDNPNTISIIATYNPMQLPHGGPNYYSFGENVRYEIHVDNDASIAGDEITYRFTFNQINEDPSTFFNIRLGAQNLKTTYTLERSTDGGMSFETIIENGVVPPYNVGPRSIESAAGLNTTYDALFTGAITTASSGETVFAGPTDDPFFVDLGGIFDLGDAPRQGGNPVDNLACLNVSAIAIQVPISTLLKAGGAAEPSSILDSDYVIGVWASASRPAITTLSSDSDPSFDGDWVQVSRLGMPLTNEAVIPIGQKDFWNSITPYDEIAETTMDEYFYNPELALYMDDDQFGGAVPAFGPLRIQKAALGAFDFSNGGDGLFSLKGSNAVEGTALDDAVFGTLLLPGEGKPRSVDLWPAFHTGVPNVIPYQLATGKEGNPLAAGKPFVNNFLPNGGDMLRLNMAVPPTARDDDNFSSLGLINAAVLGLTAAPFNTNTDIEFIPNMDGFPNGRRLEDDVTRIELQAVAGVVLAAVGLWYDDYDPMTSPSPVTDDLLGVLTYTTGVEVNDKAFGSTFPYLAQPHSGTGPCSGELIEEEEVIEAVSIGQFFVSSNTSGQIGIFDLNDDGTYTQNNVPSGGMDADGIYYDKDSDVLYQLNRSANVINAYGEFNATIMNNEQPVITASSSSDFINGREIAVRGNKLIVAQDANDGNGMTNKFIVYNISATSITLDKIYDVSQNLWGIHLDDQTLFAIEDNSNRVLRFDNIFDQPAGMLNASATVSVDGIVRTHGITYERDGDIMVLTDIGEASSDVDGGFVIINSYSQASMDGSISMSEQIRVAGASTMLGNPVDIAYDPSNALVYIAERANGGGRILSFEIPNMSGDFMPVYNQEFAGASAIYLRCADDGAYPPVAAEGNFFVSSNTMQNITVFNVTTDNTLSSSTFRSLGTDADGIYYDLNTDNLYQVNRTSSAINLFGNVLTNLENNLRPDYISTSAAEFTNGREMAFSNDKIIVAQDANMANGEQNRLIVFDVNGSSFSRSKVFDVDINLWGIHIDGDDLFAIVDNSNRLAMYKNLFAQQSGNLNTSRIVSIDGIVRTHGITYIRDRDLMILTDVGDAASATDGALVVINNYEMASMDGIVTADEQIRIEGSATFLGNPVDVALDRDRNVIYVTERANEGGRVLGFDLPAAGGNIAPSFNELVPGASGIHFPSLLDESEEEVLTTQAQLFASSNTTRSIGVYNILESNCIAERTFIGSALDADGIYYDAASDIIYQLNRSNNSVYSMVNVNANLNAKMRPNYFGSSIASFINGREITFGNGKIIVAQDANDANGNINAFHIFNVSGPSITFERVIETNINLWGIQMVGDNLIAIVDNSNQVAVFENFLSNTSLAVPSNLISIEGLVRTHGLFYDEPADIMVLTDIGEASSADDGAFVLVPNFWATAMVEGMVNTEDQIRVEGPSTMLGNPVDITWDSERSTIYIAERANGGGRILGFAMPTGSGDATPVYNSLFSGASAVYLSGENGGSQNVLFSDAVQMIRPDLEENALAVYAEMLDDATPIVQIGNSSEVYLGNSKVYPNPAINELFIDIDKSWIGSFDIQLLNANGALLQQISNKDFNGVISLKDYPEGMYLINIKSENRTEVKRFVKSNR